MIDVIARFLLFFLIFAGTLHSGKWVLTFFQPEADYNAASCYLGFILGWTLRTIWKWMTDA